MRFILACTLAFSIAVDATSADPKQPQKGPDPNEVMKEMMKLAQPGPEHKNLDVFVGKWDMTTKMWFEPGKEPAKSTATSERKSILGGRFIEEQVKGESFGKPFGGVGFMGYDNSLKKYSSIWLDNMSTSVMLSVGTYDVTKKTFTFENQEKDPVSGEVVTVKTTIRVVDKDNYVLEMTRPGPGGKEWKNFEMTAKRKK